MKITEELIERLSGLSKLSFDTEEKEYLKEYLTNFVNFSEALDKVATDDIEPLIFMSSEINNLREDVPIQTISHEEALKNAPKKDSDYFRIPKVLDITPD